MDPHLRISALSNKARTVAMKINSTGIQHQEAMQSALESQFNELQKILQESKPQLSLLYYGHLSLVDISISYKIDLVR